MSDGIPPAVVVQGGKVPGDVPAATAPPPRRTSRHDRKLSNYLIDKKLQLQYVIAVTLVSTLIAGTLGYLIYQQEHRASEDLVAGLKDLMGDDETLREYQRETASDIAKRDQKLVFQMVGVGLGLTLILSGYLVIMTHKVAGPLHKVGLYMEKMADGKLTATTPLRRGDMLQDFYIAFCEMHQAVRGRVKTDAEAMATFAQVCAEAGELGPKAKAEVAALGSHAEARKKSLS